jgi:hypothetical protein
MPNPWFFRTPGPKSLPGAASCETGFLYVLLNQQAVCPRPRQNAHFSRFFTATHLLTRILAHPSPLLYDLKSRSCAGGIRGMASLTAKVIHGRTYYYARECQRINGKPRIVRTVYLGSADDLIAAVLRQQHAPVPQPHAVAIAAFGDVVALHDLAQQIWLVELSTATSLSAIRGSPSASTSSSPHSTAPSSPRANSSSPTGIARPRCPDCSPPLPTNSPARPSGITSISSRSNTSRPSNANCRSGSSSASNCRSAR